MEFSLNSSETADTRVLKQCRPISELGGEEQSQGMERSSKLARSDSASFSSRQAENLTAANSGGGGGGGGVGGASVDDHPATASGAGSAQVPVAAVQVYDPLLSSLYHQQLGGVRSMGYGQQYAVNPMKQIPQFGSAVGFQQQYYPFTASQWAELEHQALIFKYMMARAPVPPELVTPFRRSLILSPSTNSFQLGVSTGSPMDAEPGRCRRTDGKKWRCAKPIVADQKYCERHIHRGRNRSRKAAEAAAAAAAAAQAAASSLSNTNNHHLGSGNPVNGNGSNGNSLGFDHKSCTTTSSGSGNGSKMFFSPGGMDSPGLSSGYPIQSSDSALHSTKEPRFVNGMSKDQFDFRPEQLLFSEVSGSCTRSNLGGGGGEYRRSSQGTETLGSYGGGYESIMDVNNNNHNKQPEAVRHFFVDWARKSEGGWCEEEDSKEGVLKLALENHHVNSSTTTSEDDPYTNISLARMAGGGGGDLLADVLKSGRNHHAGKPPSMGVSLVKSGSQAAALCMLSSPTGVLQKVTCFSDSSSSASSPGSVKTETSHGVAH